MRKLIVFVTILSALILLFLGATQNSQITHREALADGFIKLSITAPSLSSGKVNLPPTQTLYVYLPPSYEKSLERFPVVYYFHGFDNDSSEIYVFAKTIDSTMKNGGCKEFIIVGVNGTTELGGTFWVNSPVTGNWEDFVVHDVVPLIDENFKTISLPEGRGLAGFSMGGFASINLALRHPDLFSLSFSLAPGLFDKSGLKDAYSQWDQGFLSAYGAAFAYDLSVPFPHALIPKFDSSSADASVIDKWESGFGKLNEKVAAYLDKHIPVKKFRITYGRYDDYQWIPNGCKHLNKILSDNNISCLVQVFNWGHQITAALLQTYLLSFFNQEF